MNDRAFDVPAERYYGTLAGWRAHSYRRRRELVVERADPGGLVLDVACGDGRTVLDGFGDRGVGLDRSASMLAGARARDRSRPRRLVRADALSLPFSAGSFRTVVISHALWLFPEPGAVVREAHRVLAPGGVLLVVSNRARYFAARRAVIAALGLLGRTHAEPEPSSCRDEREIAARMREAGFAVGPAVGFMLVPFPGFGWLDRTPLGRLGYSFLLEGHVPPGGPGAASP